MKAPTTLAFRLTAWLVGLLFAFSIIAALSVGTTIRREMNEAMDGNMVQVARRLMPALIENVFDRVPQDKQIVLSDSVEDEDKPLAFQLRDASGRILLRSSSAPETPLTAAATVGFVNEGGRRIYTQAAVSNTVFVQVAEDEEVRSEEIWEAARGLIFPFAVIGPLAALSIWLVVRQLTLPVASLSNAIGERHGANLTPLPADGMPAELSAIARSVNALMKRLRNALDVEREFSANAAHELRTPLAGAIAQIDRLRAETKDETARNRAGEVKSTLQTLSRLSDRLLQLARADAVRDTSNSVADLGGAVRIFVEQFQRAHPDREFAVEGSGNGPQIRFETDSLGIVLRNLLENALRHSSNGPVNVTVDPTGVLTIRNAAPYIDEARLHDLQNRFERTRDLAEGSGLGMSIVSRLLNQGKAQLAITSRRVDQGGEFEFRIEFPLA